jgi:RNA polymerase sigma-70 factor, ECF subfamily
METSVSQSLNRQVVRAREGSQSALNRLMAACRPGLRRRAREQLPRALDRKEDASDLVQKVLHRATIQVDRFKGRSIGEFYGWLARMQDKQVLKLLRRWLTQRRDMNREKTLNPACSDQRELAVASMPILDRLSHNEECDRLRLAASWCRAEDTAVISQHLFEGRSHDEIAAELGVTPAAVRQRYCRAIRRVGEAVQLLEVMTRLGMSNLQQDVIGVHRFQGADPRQIACRLQLQEELVARWIAEAQPVFHAISKDGS